MEAQVIRTYLEWIAELPWNTRSDDQLELNHAAQILDEDHYGLQESRTGSSSSWPSGSFRPATG